MWPAGTLSVVERVPKKGTEKQAGSRTRNVIGGQNSLIIYN